MKTVFSTDCATDDEMISQHIDELGPMPSSWWENRKERCHFFDKNGHPVPGREV